jgi:hypothetical protein
MLPRHALSDLLPVFLGINKFIVAQLHRSGLRLTNLLIVGK